MRRTREENACRKDAAAVPIAGNRFLIVGGASLVGSATAAELLDHGAAEVALFDNFAFGSEEAIAHLRDHPRLRLVRGDVHAPAGPAARDARAWRARCCWRPT